MAIEEHQPEDESTIANSLSNRVSSSGDLEQAHMPIIVVCVLLGVLAAASFCWLLLELYRYQVDDKFLPKTSSWPVIFGYAVYAVGAGWLCWRLAEYANAIRAKTSERLAILASRHRTFWRTCAGAICVLTGYALFQVIYTYRQPIHHDNFYRPEFQSPEVVIAPHRIEIRRAFAEPGNGRVEMKIEGKDTRLFVSLEREITGKDIAEAKLQITELLPGEQAVHVTLKFTKEGARKMKKLTTEQQTLPLAVLIDGKLRTTPRVFSTITNNALLGGVFTLDEAARIIKNGGD